MASAEVTAAANDPFGLSFPFVVSLPVKLARQVREYVDSEDSAYEDQTEFFTQAVANQLAAAKGYRPDQG